MALAGVWIRAISSGHVKKNEELATSGPYAYTRNPLYFGSIVIAAGFALAALRWEIAVALVVLFAAIYVPVIRGEEQFLGQHFANYSEYCSRVPRLLPRLRAGDAGPLPLFARTLLEAPRIQRPARNPGGDRRPGRAALDGALNPCEP